MSLFSHEFHEDSSDEFGTPAEFHRPIADAVGGFDLDPASGAESQPLASTRYTEEDDGLAQEWFGTVWLNPPFSEKTRWVRKTRGEVADGNVETAVVLLPVDTSTKLFHNHVTDATAICFVEGRLSFDGGDRNPNFGVLLAVFGKAPDELLDVLDRKGSVFRVDAKHERSEQKELFTDGGVDQSGEGVQRRSLKFSEEFVAPVLKGEKTATVRYQLEGDVRVGDQLQAETPDGTHFATIEITRTGECMVVEAPSLIDLFGASHSADSPEDLIESLRQHYDTGFSPGTIVQVVGFEVVLRE